MNPAKVTEQGMGEGGRERRARTPLHSSVHSLSPLDGQVGQVEQKNVQSLDGSTLSYLDKAIRSLHDTPGQPAAERKANVSMPKPISMMERTSRQTQHSLGLVVNGRHLVAKELCHPFDVFDFSTRN